MRPPFRALLGGLALAGALSAVPAHAQTSPQGTSPCDGAPQMPQCVAALGPLRDVSAKAAAYQAATIQLVPISDYASDPEDAAPPVGAGVCGTETSHAAADGTTVPPGEVVDAPPAGVPPPPGTHGPYCLLRYLPADFSGLCSGCHRLLLDFSAIPDGNSTSPGAGGHWAARFSSTTFNVSSPFDGHSPNIKNLCSDKFFNPSPGSDCAPYAQIDGYGFEYEGDSSIYHHYPLEGRYYNGPAYLAGDGTHQHPYHWVTGAYLDLDPKGNTGLSVWYGTGYRGKGDSTPDTDQSYGCLCELPPVGHSAFSASYPLADLSATQTGPGGGGNGRGGGGSDVVATSVSNATAAALPDTGAARPGTAAAAGALLLTLAARLHRRRRGRR
jgi:LPXTG-motif cell wall-anchored protein